MYHIAYDISMLLYVYTYALFYVICCNISIKEIDRNINIEISKVTTWLQRNKLQLNVSKSKIMMFLKHPKTLPKLQGWGSSTVLVLGTCT